MQIEELRKCWNSGKIKWYQHSLERMQERDIGRKDIRNCIFNGEIIEDYPDDFPHPSCLVFEYMVNNDIIHVVVSKNNDEIGIITAYRPSADKFGEDLKTRREK